MTVSLKIVQSIGYFNELSDEMKQYLADSFIQKTYRKDEEIIKQGDNGDGFYILKEGSLSVEIDGERVSRLRDGDFFGEISLITSEPRTATIGVMSDTAEVLYLSVEAFEKVKSQMPRDIQTEVMRRIRENAKRSKDTFYI